MRDFRRVCILAVDMKIVVYVLCPHEEAMTSATQAYGDKPWARVVHLPQDQPYLESYMYTSWLARHEDEWRDADWVGCIAWSASRKQPLVTRIDEICEHASGNGSDFIGLMYRGDPLVETAERWHPGFARAWIAAWTSLGWPTDLVLNEQVPSFYCNYWVTKPQIMSQYCTTMAYLVTRMETVPELKEMMVSDSTYHERGPTVAKMTHDMCEDRFGVRYYPMYIFVMERMICVFASVVASKFVFIR